MSRYLLFCAWFGLTSFLCKAQPPDTSGVGSVWTMNDAAGHKVVAGISCDRVVADGDAADTDKFNMVFIAYEVDQADDGMVKYFDYKVGQALDRAMIDANMKVLPAAGCADYTADGDAFHKFEIEIDQTVATPPCGIQKDIGDPLIYKIAVRVSRYVAYDSQYDRVFLAQCKADDPTQTLITTLDGPMVQVGPIAKELLTRRYVVSLDAIEGDVPPDYSTDTVITAAIDLGLPIRLRICLDIGSALGDTRTMFDADGLGVVGINVPKCIARRAASQPIDMGNTNLTNEAVFLENSCSKNEPVAKTADGTKSRFQWYKASTDGANSWMFPPNCWYFGPYEGVAFMGKTIQTGAADRITEITCELEYCKASTEAPCFGNLAGDGSDQAAYTPVCAKRKRREADDVFANLTDLLPKTVSTTLTIRMTEGDTGAKTDEDCFDTPTFYALTAVLAVLLVIVMAIAGFLALKLRSVMNDIDSQDSKVGIQNKAFY